MKLLQRVWNDIQRGENIHFYLSVVAAIALGILNLLGFVPQQWLTPITLIILGLLAVSNLINRDRLVKLGSDFTQSTDRLHGEIERLNKALDRAGKGQVTAASFFHIRADTPLATQIQGAKTLDMLGTTLISVAITNQAAIRNLKESGATIRLIVSNPDSKYLHRVYATRFLEVESPEQHATSVRTALTNFETLIGKSASGGSLEVKIVDRDISYSYIGVDTAAPTGRISVELYLTKVSLNENPIFTLNAATDPHWYNVFRNQFEIFWNSVDMLYRPHKSPS